MNSTAAAKSTTSSHTAPLFGLVDEHWIDFAVSHIRPLFSLSRTKVRVVAITHETSDAIRIEFEPNKNWKGHVPGQFVLLKVSIGGVIHERCYSLISTPGSRTLAIAVKRQPNGLVSNWLNDHLLVGDLLEVGFAAGTFHFDGEVPDRVLLIAGGSGITPVFALAEQALMARPDADVVLAYYARTKTDFILGAELEALAAGNPRLHLHFFVDSDAAGTGYAVESARVGRFGADHVDAIAGDVARREIFVCGPPGLMNAVTAYCDANGHASRLHRENFGPAFAPRSSDEPAEVVFGRTGLTTTTTKPTLLEAAEEAGLRPAFGCRMGICHTCTCTKVSGSVRDRVTGVVDDAPGSRIRLCISEPVSAVELDL